MSVSTDASIIARHASGYDITLNRAKRPRSQRLRSRQCSHSPDLADRVELTIRWQVIKSGLNALERAVFPPLSRVDFRRVSLGGEEHIALVDNQAGSNVMSLNFARSHDINIEPASVTFLLADGETHFSIGQAFVDFAFRHIPALTIKFHIFTHAIFPIILGRQLLREIRILGSLPSELKCPPQSQIRIVVEHQTKIAVEATAILDKGSAKNIMSLAFAKRNGYLVPMEPNGSASSLIRIGNGITVRNSGRAKAYLRIPTMEGKKGTPNSHLQIGCHFVILSGFPFDLALGNTFVRRYGTAIFNHATLDSQRKSIPADFGNECSRLFLGVDSKPGTGKTTGSLT